MRVKRQTRGVARRRAATVEDAIRAWELRSQGASLRDIAKAMNLSGPQFAKNLVENGFKEFYSPKVEQRRAEADALLSSLIAEFAPVALGLGKRKAPLDQRLAATDRILKANRELRALHGLDAPEALVQLTAELPSKDVRQQLLDRLASLAESASARAGDPKPDG